MGTEKTAVEAPVTERRELLRLVYRENDLLGGAQLLPFAFLLCSPEEVRYTWLVEDLMLDLGLGKDDYQDMTESLEMLVTTLCSDDRGEEGDTSIALDATSGFGDLKVLSTLSYDLTPEGAQELNTRETGGLILAYMQCWKARTQDLAVLLEKWAKEEGGVQSRTMEKREGACAH